jgi:hypothetical protein
MWKLRSPTHSRVILMKSSFGKEQQQRRLVVAASNGQSVDFVDNWAQSLLRQNMTNFVLVPLDTIAYEKVHVAYPLHTLPILPELVVVGTKEAKFGSKEFALLTASRPIFLNRFLQQNITIFYNDIDMVWQSKAWNTIDWLLLQPASSSSSSSSSNQHRAAPKTYNVVLWKDGPIQICTCMMYMVPSSAASYILQEWNQEI